MRVALWFGAGWPKLFVLHVNHFVKSWLSWVSPTIHSLISTMHSKSGCSVLLYRTKHQSTCRISHLKFKPTTLKPLNFLHMLPHPQDVMDHMDMIFTNKSLWLCWQESCESLPRSTTLYGNCTSYCNYCHDTAVMSLSPPQSQCSGSLDTVKHICTYDHLHIHKKIKYTYIN